MDEWPQLLVPRSERWNLQGTTISGGNPLIGGPKVSRTDGGGFWVGEQSFLLTEPSEIRLARAVEAILEGGVGFMVAWSDEDRFAPTGLAVGTSPHSDGSPFSDGSLYRTGGSGAVVTEAAATRAARLKIDVLAGALMGGERFSIVHTRKGRRRYRIKRVSDGEIVIQPPLREAIPAGEVLDFLRVGCVARLANPDEVMGALTAEVQIEFNARWVEAP